MSMQNLVSFYSAVESDAAMRNELQQRIGDKKDGDAAEAIYQFANAKGYEVTPDDLAEGVTVLNKMQSGQQDELSDRELEVVSGGKGSAQSALSSVGSFLDKNLGADNWKAAGNPANWLKKDSWRIA